MRARVGIAWWEHFSMPALTYLEMTHASDVVRGAGSGAAGVELRRIEGSAVRALTLAVGRNFSWPSQTWTEAEWADYLADPQFVHFVGTVAGEDIGILSLNTRQFPEVEIDSFGILPGLIGRGIGRAFLSEALDTIWADCPKRIWLHTSSDDHPNALRNYLARGFRIYEP